MYWVLLGTLLSLFLLFVEGSGRSLVDELKAVRFLHEGVARDIDSYSWLPIECMYLEAENVTCSQCSWAGPCSYKYIVDSVPGTA
jgi:hypothetical protein